MTFALMVQIKPRLSMLQTDCSFPVRSPLISPWVPPPLHPCTSRSTSHLMVPSSEFASVLWPLYLLSMSGMVFPKI